MACSFSVNRLLQRHTEPLFAGRYTLGKVRLNPVDRANKRRRRSGSGIGFESNVCGSDGDPGGDLEYIGILSKFATTGRSHV